MQSPFSDRCVVTKLRDPLTIENTLKIVVDNLGPDRVFAATGKTKAYFDGCTDQDTRQKLRMDHAILLDLASDAKDGEGFLLHELYGRMLKTLQAEREAAAACISEHVSKLACETSESIASLCKVIRDAGDTAAVREAVRETEDLIRAGHATVAMLRHQLARAEAGEASPQPP
jgi:hypothetical protein